MKSARLFLVGQALFLTAPFALAMALYAVDRTGNGFVLFLFVLPYMAVALLAQLFRCPRCAARPYSLERAGGIGLDKYLTPRFVTRCWNCKASFWRSGERPMN